MGKWGNPPDREAEIDYHGRRFFELCVEAGPDVLGRETMALMVAILVALARSEEDALKGHQAFTADLRECVIKVYRTKREGKGSSS